jgi:hypothetical protein
MVIICLAAIFECPAYDSCTINKFKKKQHMIRLLVTTSNVTKIKAICAMF